MVLVASLGKDGAGVDAGVGGLDALLSSPPTTGRAILPLSQPAGFNDPGLKSKRNMININ